MNDSLSAQPVVLSIAAIERDTGLSKDTLRVWERHYGFPVPMRDSQRERSYPLDQLQRPRTLKRLIDGRHRPGRVVCLDAGELERLLRATGVQAPEPSMSVVPVTGQELAALMACT